MDRSELALSIGIRQLASHMDAISHNIANVNSMGYKRRVANFDEALLEAERSNDPASPSLPLPAYREQGDVSQGDLQTTSDPLNIALSGKGYLGVVLPSGELAYTRNGELALGPNGALLTVGGDRVANDQGLPIEIPGGQAFNISRTGDVVDKDSGAILGKLGIFQFEDSARLLPVGSSRFVPTQESGPAVRDRVTTVEQGNLERSNVDTVQELVSMITVQRHYDLLTRAMRVVGQTNDSLFAASSR